MNFAKHPARRYGRRDDLLVLRENDELGVLMTPRGRAPGAPPIRVNPNPRPAQRHRAAAP